MNGSAVITMNSDPPLQYGFAFGVDVGGAKDLGRAGDVALSGGSDVICL